MAIKYKEFSMSMFKNKEDLYKAKAEYYENLAIEMNNVLISVVELKRDGFNEAIKYLAGD